MTEGLIVEHRSESVGLLLCGTHESVIKSHKNINEGN